MADPELADSLRHALVRSLERVPLSAPSPSSGRYQQASEDRRNRKPVLIGAAGCVAAALLFATFVTGSPSPLVWAAEAGGSLNWLQSGPVQWLPFESARPSPDATPAAASNPVAQVTSPAPRPSGGGQTPVPVAGGTPSPATQPSPSSAPSPTPLASPSPITSVSPSPSPKPSPSPAPSPSPSPLVLNLGTVLVTPNPATIGQDIVVSGLGWTPGGRLVLTLIEGSITDTLSDSVQVSSTGQMSWKGGVPGQFVPGTGTVRACYQGTTNCQTSAPIVLVQQTN